MRWWTPVAILAALAPFPLVAVGSSVLAERMAEDMAASIDRVAAALPEEQEPPERRIPTARAPAPRASAAPAPPKERPRGIGVLVRRKKLAALVAAGARPGGRPVPATSFRPAGIALAGVSGLGIGMRDGDVLTAVGGAPATSYGAVVSAVAAALKAGAPSISGMAWRGEQRIFITVELPRVETRRAERPRAAGTRPL